MLKFSNFGKAIVGSAPSGTTGLSFTVESGKGLLFPSLGSGDYFYGILKDASGNREIVKITARSTDAMTIAVGGRGLDGTTARTWATGDYFVAGLVNVALQETLSNANLTAFGALSGAADKLPYFSGAGAVTLAGFTAFARSLLDDGDAAAARATLGVPATIAQLIPSGTAMLFYQKTAPLGWTQDANAGLNHALRVVPAGGSGVGGSTGGSVAFTTAFASKAVTGSNAGTSLDTNTMARHYHTISTGLANNPGGYVPYAGNGVGGWYWSGAATDYNGQGWPHYHAFTGNAINLAVQYLNVIVATKT